MDTRAGGGLNTKFSRGALRLVAVTDHPTGKRLHLFARRTHHGDWGLLAILGGLVWCWRDRHDAREWLRFRRELRMR